MFEFQLPVKITAGVGAFEECGKGISVLGSKALIVCDPGITKLGLPERLRKILASAGMESILYDKVVPNPTTDIVDAGGVFAREKKCDVVIGLGGGSSMDAAKTIAITACHEGTVWPYVTVEKEPTDATLPIVAITTTSGTGSHCNPFAVVTNPRIDQKPGFASMYMWPKLAIVDPLLPATMPSQLTAITGLDVFTHSVEAYTSQWASPITDMFAMRAIELLAENLPLAYADGNDISARQAMATADTFGGIAISHAMVNLAHSLAHTISGHYHDVAHGDAINTVYPAVLAINKASLPEKHEWIALTISGGKETDVVMAYKKFFGTFDFPNRVKDYQPDDGVIMSMAEDVFGYMKLATSLGPVKTDIESIRKAFTDSIR